MDIDPLNHIRPARKNGQTAALAAARLIFRSRNGALLGEDTAHATTKPKIPLCHARTLNQRPLRFYRDVK